MVCFRNAITLINDRHVFIVEGAPHFSVDVWIARSAMTSRYNRVKPFLSQFLQFLTQHLARTAFYRYFPTDRIKELRNENVEMADQ